MTNPDLVDVGAYRHAAPFVPLRIGDTDPATYIVAALLGQVPQEAIRCVDMKKIEERQASIN